MIKDKTKPRTAAFLKELLAVINHESWLRIYKLSSADYTALCDIAEKMAKNKSAGFKQYNIFEFLQRYRFNVCVCEIGYIASEPEEA